MHLFIANNCIQQCVTSEHLGQVSYIGYETHLLIFIQKQRNLDMGMSLCCTLSPVFVKMMSLLINFTIK